MSRKRRQHETVLELLRDPQKRRAWIIYQLSLQGKTLASVGRDLRVTRGAVYAVFKAPYPKMEKALATELGVEPSFLFPERYDEFGKPKRPRDDTRKSPRMSGKNKAQKTGRKGKKEDA